MTFISVWKKNVVYQRWVRTQPSGFQSFWWQPTEINTFYIMIQEEIYVYVCMCIYIYIYEQFPQWLSVNNPPAMQAPKKMQVWFLGGKNSLEEGMATHSSTLAWRIPWTDEFGELQSMGSQRVKRKWSYLAHMHHIYKHEFLYLLIYM